MRWEELEKGLKKLVRNTLSTNHSIKFLENEDLKEQFFKQIQISNNHAAKKQQFGLYD